MTGLSFGSALAALKLGLRVKRHGWKAYISLLDRKGDNIFTIYSLDGSKKAHWRIQDIDLLAEDWEVLSDGDLQK